MRDPDDADRPDDRPSAAVVWLDDPSAGNAACTGAKAANLAIAANADLPVLPGFVVTTGATTGGAIDEATERSVIEAWSRLVDGNGAVVVVVRSSSTIEDAGESSMAGRFTSVLDVRGPGHLLEAIDSVLASARRVRDTDGAVRPIAVLVQRQLDTTLGGVMFGVDPVTGRRDHVVVEAVRSGPDELVSGRATADHLVLTRRGRIVAVESATPGAPVTLPLRRRRELVALAARAEQVFGAPQDVEWAVDERDRLVLLQARPVTAVADGHATARSARVYGPGPLAETFPAPLAPLEADLWLGPIGDGLRRALMAIGAGDRERMSEAPVVVCVGGRAAIDLSLIRSIGISGRRRWLDPRVIARRLATAWRVGRLRVALTPLVAAITATVDEHLGGVAPLEHLDRTELTRLLRVTQSELATVHAYEMLCGIVEHPDEREYVSLPRAAMDAVAALRRAGIDDAEVVASEPMALALTVPSIGASTSVLPPIDESAAPPEQRRSSTDEPRLTDRDGLRLRCRWLQELGAQTAHEIGRRLADEGTLDDPADIRWLTVADLDHDDVRRPTPAELAARSAALRHEPLPARFRLTDGEVAPADHRHARRGRVHDGARLHGMPASSGRVTGRVVHEPPAPSRATGAKPVLVVAHLDPALATALSSVGGLVAETGSALSHLSILAREARVPAVVAVTDARRLIPEGAMVEIDGAAGRVTVVGTPVVGSGAPS